MINKNFDLKITGFDYATSIYGINGDRNFLYNKIII